MKNPEPLLLLLETATSVCSVALSEGSTILAIRNSREDREHAAMLTIFIQEVMEVTGKDLEEIDAVVVSKGPGSYTGLRIGTAVAKGICYALNKPLIGIPTPMAMAAGYLGAHHHELTPDTILVPVIDARRMEVYGAPCSMQGELVEAIRAEILHKDSFILDPQLPHVFFGDAAGKCVEVYADQSLVKVDVAFNLSASGLLLHGRRAFEQKQFESVAYFEPYYLKEFVVKTGQRN